MDHGRVRPPGCSSATPVAADLAFGQRVTVMALLRPTPDHPCADVDRDDLR
jgi:hypothetical protein